MRAAEAGGRAGPDDAGEQRSPADLVRARSGRSAQPADLPGGARQGQAVVRIRRRAGRVHAQREQGRDYRSEEHTSELQSLMRISYAVFCLKKKTTQDSNVYNV